MSKQFYTRLLLPMAAAMVAAPLAAMSPSFAQNNTQDGMKAPASSMSKDAMSPGGGTGMKHDAMMHHPMKKDAMHSGSMSKDTMSHDTMSPNQPKN